ncbi:unnamed protein product [Arctia plantaginis]|uniref:Uncharacterized protein n=1 Tax=Arctia plantaginis TaxID=874455 RepID=A0A8S1AY69_ARCPL|nr:unnamed protein product [Arctia plantaginis]
MATTRTPTKRQEETDLPPPKQPARLSRHSLEKWESTASASTTVGTQGAPTTSRSKGPITKKPTDSPKEGVEVRAHASTVTTTTANKKTKTQEAAALVMRAKMALSQSKNLKTEVKETLIDVLGKLKKLVGDSEAEREAEKGRKGSGGAGDGVPVNINTCASSAVPPDSGPSKILEEHSRLLLEHKEGMKALQEEMAKCTQAIEEQRRSYATVAASTPHKLMQPLRPAEKEHRFKLDIR